jgi:hypothetical protein
VTGGTTDLYYSYVVAPSGITRSVGPVQASYTGGAPGTPSYSWALIATPANPTSMLNPTDASSQIVQITNMTAPLGATSFYQATLRVTVTDALGNVSTQDQIVTMEIEHIDANG